MSLLNPLGLPPAQRKFLRIRSFSWFLRLTVIGGLLLLFLSYGIIRP